MDPCGILFKVHEAFECELCTFIVRERAVLARLKPVMPVKVALQREFRPYFPGCLGSTEGIGLGTISILDSTAIKRRDNICLHLASCEYRRGSSDRALDPCTQCDTRRSLRHHYLRQ